MNVDQRVLDFLLLHPSSAGLSDEALRQVANCARVVEVDEGAVVQQPGRPIDEIHCVVDGRLRLVVTGDDRQEFVVAFVPAGSQFGVLSLFDEVVAPIRVVADVDSKLLVISRIDAIRLARELPLWKRNLVAQFGGQLQSDVNEERQRRRETSIGVMYTGDRTRAVGHRLMERLLDAGESLTVFSDQPSTTISARDAVRVHSLRDENGEIIDPPHARHLIEQQQVATRVVLEMSLTSDPAAATLLDYCSRTYVLVDTDHAAAARLSLGEMPRRFDDADRDVRWVWCLTPRQPVVPKAERTSAHVKRRIVLHLPDRSGANRRMAEHGLARLLHDVRDSRIGIALGGGAARGMAHLGVLQSLEDSGIVFDAISGTSAGAMVGIVYASGMPANEAAEHFAKDLTPSAVERKIPGGQGIYLLRKYRSGGWDPMLRRYLQDWQLQQLPTPVTGVAVDLVTGRQVASSTGDAVQTILDSINLPGLNPPICRDGMALVDGGILNTLPADSLVQQHQCDYILSVDVSAAFADEFVGNRSDTPTREMHVPGVFQTVVRAMNVQHRDVSAMRARVSDFTIEPDVKDVDAGDFQDAVEIAEIGRAATEAVIEELASQLTRIDPILRPHVT